MATLIFISVMAFALLFGSFASTNSEKIIDIYKKLYYLINWRTEPISAPKRDPQYQTNGPFSYPIYHN